MGYYSHLDGRIEINPPLTWSEFRDSEYLRRGHEATKSITLEIEAEVRETDEGVVTIKRAVAIVPAFDEEGKFYSVKEDLDELVGHNAFATRRLTGTLVRTGAEQGDVERYTVRDGRIVTEKATLRWPDGTDVGL